MRLFFVRKPNVSSGPPNGLIGVWGSVGVVMGCGMGCGVVRSADDSGCAESGWWRYGVGRARKGRRGVCDGLGGEGVGVCVEAIVGGFSFV